MSNHVYSNDFFCFVSSMKSSTQECKLEQIYAKECNKPFFFLNKISIIVACYVGYITTF